MFAAVCLITVSANAQTKKGTVLLGAGSQFSDTEWTQWSITPKIGYFIQDGLAIGALVHFDSEDRYFPAFAGNVVEDINNPGTFVYENGHSDYTLTNNIREFGVFARYYAARNLFMEVNLSSQTSQSETWTPNVLVFDVPSQSLVPQDLVQQTRTQSSHVRFGMGYTLVWREHFAVEPFIHLDLIVDGEEVLPGSGAMTNAETIDLSGSEFIAGVNFSLFF